MVKVEIYLKSGHTIIIECEDFESTFDSTIGEYTGYKYRGLKNPYKLSMCPTEIVGWVQIK